MQFLFNIVDRVFRSNWQFLSLYPFCNFGVTLLIFNGGGFFCVVIISGVFSVVALFIDFIVEVT